MVSEVDSNSNKAVSNETTSIVKPFSSSIQYALVDEALAAFEAERYAVMFGAVSTLSHLFDGNGTIKNRLFRLCRGVDINDINGNTVEIPAYNLMRGAFSVLNMRGRYVETFRDVNRKVVYVFISDLLEAYYYVGRILHISLFEILRSNNIELPEEIYANRYAGNQE